MVNGRLRSKGQERKGRFKERNSIDLLLFKLVVNFFVNGKTKVIYVMGGLLNLLFLQRQNSISNRTFKKHIKSIRANRTPRGLF